MERVAKWSPFFLLVPAWTLGMAARAAGRRLGAFAQLSPSRGLQAEGYRGGVMCSVWVKRKRATAVALASKNRIINVAFY